MPPPRRDDGASEPAPRPGAALDTDLVAGFAFACRPDCGLCCYAAPSLREGELGALLAILPSFTTDRDHPGQIPSRADGGACSMLVRNRCSVHAARPGPCAEFPLSSHLSDRIQVSVVLSCPGLRLDALRGPAVPRDGAAPRIDTSLSSELEAVRRAVARLTDSEL
ncbi:MAG: YkgJ family cysteine cluster protein, partial [Thermoplasmata archaeon]|nr:YkgJ family cysteine cluster protein [Thermoplasmata archaeon]